MKIEILHGDFDPWTAVSCYQRDSGLRPGVFGACVVFVGNMRDFNEDEGVQSMRLEHYARMTEKHLERIAQEAVKRWALNDVLILHRVGDIHPGDPIVLVATWAAHRSAAYDANRYIMEDLKSKAPFWKKEQLAARTRWVDKNTPG